MPHSLNVPKSLYQSPSGTSGSSAFHSAKAKILLGDPAFLRPLAEVGPLIAWKALPSNFRHSTAENQCTELVNHLILLTRIVIREVCFQFPEKLSFAAFLFFKSQTHEGGDRLTNACVGGSRIPGNIVGNGRGQRHGVSGRRTGLALASRLLTTGARGLISGVSHTSSLCLTMHHLPTRPACQSWCTDY